MKSNKTEYYSIDLIDKIELIHALNKLQPGLTRNISKLNQAKRDLDVLDMRAHMGLPVRQEIVKLLSSLIE